MSLVRCLSAVMLGLVACGARPSPPPPRAAAPPSVASVAPVRIDPDPAAAQRIAADVTYLASPELAGRGTGEEGARLAAEFVEHRFRDLHLAPFAHAGAKDPTYREPFPARTGAHVEPAKLSLASGKAKAPSPVDATSVVTADGSASGEAAGPLVFVGYGVRAPALGWDDYAAADVTGKVVVVLDGAPQAGPHAEAFRDFGSIRYKLRTAREQKAAGVIVLARGDELPAAPTDPSEMGLPGVVLKRSVMAPLLARAKIDVDKVRDESSPAPGIAASRAKALGEVRATLATRIEPVVVEAWNVVGLLPAAPSSPHKGEYVVVGAHYDHLGYGGSASRAPGVHAIHPGADDNASGVALLLEVARRFAALPTRPARNIVFVAFSAEEIGAIGSRYFVDHPPVPIASIVGMINADMVGRMQNHRLIIDGVGTSAGWPALVSEAAAGLGIEITTGGEGFGASDHASFTAARVPVAFLFTGVHDDYHKPSDTADKINAAGESLVTTLAARLTELVAERDQRLAFVDAPADPHRGMRGGFRVSLGTLPDYAYQGKGLRLSGVRPDAPAQRAGLQAGDVVVKLGEHDITNIHDYMFALGELEPGRETRIEVERAGKRISLSIIPAPGR